MKRLIFLAMLVMCGALLFSIQAAAQDRTAEYEKLVAKIKGGDTSVDFKALRLAFADSTYYKSEGVDAKLTSDIVKSSQAKKYADVVKNAEEVFKTNFVDMNTHIYATVAYKALGDAKKSDLHKAVYIGLINSITNSGDGIAPKTAYTVITVSEEYAVLDAFDLKRTTYEVVNDGGHKYDMLTAKDAAGTEQKIYFNIDIVWKGYEKLIKKP